MVGKIEALQREESFITIERRRIAIKRIYPDKFTGSPVLVFLHEGLGCIELWRDFPEYICLAAGLSGLVYDRLGHGRSDPFAQKRSARYLHDEALIYLPALLKKTGIENPILIGHSDGGTIALLFAGHYADCPAGLITEAAHVFIESITLEGIKKTAALYESGKLKTGLAKYHGGKTDSLFYGWAHTWLSPEFESWNIVNELRNITTPSLIIQGTDDEYGTEEQVDAIVQAVSGESEKLMVPRCGHIPHFQARDLVAAQMTQFIKKVTGKL